MVHADVKYENKGETDKPSAGGGPVAEVLGGRTYNPDAVQQLGMDILMGFRRKAFVLLTLQSLVVWGLASCIARIPMLVDREFLVLTKEPKQELYMDAGILAVAFFMTIVSLAATYCVRYRFPANMACLSVFTVLLSLFLALIGGTNCFYGLALAVGCEIAIAVPSCLRFKGRTVEVFPVATVVSLVMLPTGFFGWQVLAPEIHSAWVVISLVLNFFGTVWLGYEMDWMCARLKPDEYLMPIVLVWVEILAVVAIAFICMMGGQMQDGGSCSGGCNAPVVIYWRCDCWIYDGGESSRKAYYRKLEEFRAQKAAASVEKPEQQTMGEQV